MGGHKPRKLHESTSRALCRLGFVVLAVMPLTACLIWAAMQWTPFYQDWLRSHYEGVLSARLGFPVSIGSVETLSPFRARFGEVRIQDPENGDVVAHAGLVVVSTSGSSTEVKIFGAKLPTRSSDATRLRLSWQTIHDAFLCRPSDEISQTLVQCDRISIGHFVLDDASLELSSRREQTMAKVQFAAATRDQLAANHDEQRQSTTSNETAIMLLRHHEGEQRSSEVLVQFPEAGLQAGLAARVFPVLQSLGNAASLHGELGAFKRGEYAWEFCCGESLAEGNCLNGLVYGQLVGPDPSLLQIRDVEFGTLCWTSPLDLAGRGSLTITDGYSTADRELQALAVEAWIFEGRIGRIALHKAADFWGIELNSELRGSTRGDEAFSEARWQIRIDPQSTMLDLWGYFAETDGSRWNILASTNDQVALGLRQVVAMLQNADAQRENRLVTESNVYTHWVAEFARWLPLEPSDPTLNDPSFRLSKTQDPSPF